MAGLQRHRSPFHQVEQLDKGSISPWKSSFPSSIHCAFRTSESSFVVHSETRLVASSCIRVEKSLSPTSSNPYESSPRLADNPRRTTICHTTPSLHPFTTPALPVIMSFSSLVSDLTYRDRNGGGDDKRSTISRAKSYASTAATSVSLTGDISSQLHGGYNHPLARAWQAERQLTKVRVSLLPHATQ